MDADMNALRGSLIAERYRLDEILVEDAIGVVFQSFDLTDERPVALRNLADWVVTSSEAAAAFRRRGRALRKLDHPAIVRVLDFAAVPGHAFIVSELVAGAPLDAAMLPRSQSPEAVCALLAPIADALAHAHAQGIVHGDVRPANIIVAGTPRLAEFGVTLLAARSPDRPAELELGDSAYRSPEQEAGRAVTRASDVFALGTIAADLLRDPRDEALASLISVMLASGVRARPSAADVASRLRELGARTTTNGRPARNDGPTVAEPVEDTPAVQNTATQGTPAAAAPAAAAQRGGAAAEHAGVDEPPFVEAPSGAAHRAGVGPSSAPEAAPRRRRLPFLVLLVLVALLVAAAILLLTRHSSHPVAATSAPAATTTPTTTATTAATVTSAPPTTATVSAVALVPLAGGGCPVSVPTGWKLIWQRLDRGDGMHTELAGPGGARLACDLATTPLPPRAAARAARVPGATNVRNALLTVAGRPAVARSYETGSAGAGGVIRFEQRFLPGGVTLTASAPSASFAAVAPTFEAVFGSYHRASG
jgi:hypothetical protein